MLELMVPRGGAPVISQDFAKIVVFYRQSLAIPTRIPTLKAAARQSTMSALGGLLRRHRGTGRHLRLANGVHAGEQGLRAQRGLGNGRTTAIWTATLTWLSWSFFAGPSLPSVVHRAPMALLSAETDQILITSFVLWFLVAAFHVDSRSR